MTQLHHPARNGAAPAGSEPSSGYASDDRAQLPTTLWLSRHGQTVWHAENRYAGTSDVNLTDVGREQATALAGWADRHRPDAFYSSPVRRALETAAPVAAVLGMAPTVEEDLREVHFGIAEGLTIKDLRTRHPAAAARFESDPIAGSFPDAEAPADAADRGVSALRRIAARHAGGSVLVVAHNTLIRLALCSLLGIPLAHYRRSLPRLDNGTLTSIRLVGAADAGCALLSFNVPLEASLVLS